MNKLSTLSGVLLVLVAAITATLVGCKRQEASTTGVAAPAPPPISIGTEIDDAVITTRVKSALMGDPDVKGFDIKAETRKGTVQLSGFVDSQIAVDRALAVVKRVEGIKGVDNSMSIKDGKATVGNAVDDGIVTTRVKSALLTDARIKSFDIAVVTRKGKVQLSGFVDNQSQIDRALEVTKAIGGVQGVDNELSIKK